MNEVDFNFCPKCGRRLHKSNKYPTNFCNHCGNDLRKEMNFKQNKVQCTICHDNIWLKRNKSIQCSFCGSRYHFSCISSWLRNYNSCPMCQNVYLNPIPSKKNRIN